MKMCRSSKITTQEGVAIVQHGSNLRIVKENGNELEVNLPPSRIYLASGRGCPAFTFGGLRPKVCIAQSLESSLSDDELRCVYSFFLYLYLREAGRKVQADTVNGSLSLQYREGQLSLLS